MIDDVGPACTLFSESLHKKLSFPHPHPPPPSTTNLKTQISHSRSSPHLSLILTPFLFKGHVITHVPNNYITTHSLSASFLVGLAPFFPLKPFIFFNSVNRCIALLFP